MATGQIRCNGRRLGRVLGQLDRGLETRREDQQEPYEHDLEGGGSIWETLEILTGTPRRLFFLFEF